MQMHGIEQQLVIDTCLQNGASVIEIDEQYRRVDPKVYNCAYIIQKSKKFSEGWFEL